MIYQLRMIPLEFRDDRQSGGLILQYLEPHLPRLNRHPESADRCLRRELTSLIDFVPCRGDYRQ